MADIIIDTPKEHEIAASLDELVKQVAALNVIVRDIQKAVKTGK